MRVKLPAYTRYSRNEWF